MKTSKNFSFGTVKVEDTSTNYLIHFPAGFAIEVNQEEWGELYDFVNNSIDFINNN